MCQYVLLICFSKGIRDWGETINSENFGVCREGSKTLGPLDSMCSR